MLAIKKTQYLKKKQILVHLNIIYLVEYFASSSSSPHLLLPPPPSITLCNGCQMLINLFL